MELIFDGILRKNIGAGNHYMTVPADLVRNGCLQSGRAYRVIIEPLTTVKKEGQSPIKDKTKRGKKNAKGRTMGKG